MRQWDIGGKTVMITGATGGIGLAAACQLARAGAELVLLGRDGERGRAAIEAVKRVSPKSRVDFLQADFARLADVRRATDAFLASGRPLHVLVNNAGVMCTGRRLTADGHEEMFGVNHLAHYLLTRRLLARLGENAQARIVHVASNAHHFCKGINWDDLTQERGFSAFPAYGHSKLANILFSNELARRLRGSGTSSNAMHPGAVSTGIGNQNAAWIAGAVKLVLKPFFRSPDKGAETAVHLAASPAVGEVTGRYFIDLKQVQPKPWAEDPAAAGRLWGVSEKLVAEYL